MLGLFLMMSVANASLPVYNISLEVKTPHHVGISLQRLLVEDGKIARGSQTDVTGTTEWSIIATSKTSKDPILLTIEVSKTDINGKRVIISKPQLSVLAGEAAEMEVGERSPASGKEIPSLKVSAIVNRTKL